MNQILGENFNSGIKNDENTINKTNNKLFKNFEENTNKVNYGYDYADFVQDPFNNSFKNPQNMNYSAPQKDVFIPKINNFENNNSNNKKAIGGVIIFALLIIIFVIGLSTFGFFFFFNKKNSKPNTPVNEKPVITADLSSTGTEVKIKITSKNIINSVVFSWNDDLSTEKSYQNLTNENFSQNIPVPFGTNKLKIKAIDDKNNTSFYENEFTNNSGKDIENPKIKLDIENQEGKYIRVNVFDNNSLEEVKYKWNDEEYNQVEIRDEKANNVSFNIDIKQGTNKLTIFAKDTSGNTEEITKEFDGLEAPVINFEVSDDKNGIIIKVTHPQGVKGISYTLNGTFYSNNNIPGTPTVVRTEVSLTQKESIIEVEAVSVNGVKSQKETRKIEKTNSTRLDQYGNPINDENNNTNNNNQTNQNSQTHNNQTNNNNQTNQNNVNR